MEDEREQMKMNLAKEIQHSEIGLSRNSLEYEMTHPFHIQD